jgi:hypothetical protein
MKYKTIIFLMVAAQFLSACSGKPESSKVALASNEDGKICKYEKTTGSRIGTKICRTPQQIEIEKEKAQDAMKRLTRGQMKSGK